MHARASSHILALVVGARKIGICGSVHFPTMLENGPKPAQNLGDSSPEQRVSPGNCLRRFGPPPVANTRVEEGSFNLTATNAYQTQFIDCGWL